MSSKRQRNFATVVYPDSCPDNWIDILSEFHIGAFISPLHDQDTNPDNTPKKPHYHVLLMYEGVHTIEQAQEVFSSIGGVGVEVVSSVRGYARYLCHLDNPEKHRYNDQDVICLSGTDFSSIISLASDRYQAIKEIMDFCSDNCVYSYAELLEYSAIYKYDWFRILCDSATLVIKEYLKSKYWEITSLNHSNDI